MINVTRCKKVPDSLNVKEIKAYIQESVNYLSDPVNNPKPKQSVPYRDSDLLKAFDENFYSKCYLTETKYSNSWLMDIEHFVPQNERPDLVYEWTNLFPADHYANMVKPRKNPEGGYLDPSNPNDDVETEIIYTLSAYGYDPDFISRDNKNIKALNTCELLKRVHNGHDQNTKNGTENLRHSIHKKYISILNKIIEWQGCCKGTQEEIQARRELKDLLSRKSSFTMLMRSMPAVRRLSSDFFD